MRPTSFWCLGKSGHAVRGALVIAQRCCLSFFLSVLISACGAKPAPPQPKPLPLKQRAKHVLDVLSNPTLEFWPQHYSPVNPFGAVLTAPMRDEKTFQDFRDAYFETAARGVDMSAFDTQMDTLFKKYGPQMDLQAWRTELQGLATTMRAAQTPVCLGPAFTFAALGASDAVGAGASPPSQAYVYLLAKKLRARYECVSVHNLAQSGKTTANVRKDQLPQALALKPDLVVFSAGLNDLQYGVPTAELKANVEYVLKELREHTPARVVMTRLSVAGYLPLMQANIPKLRERRQNLSPQRIAEFNAVFDELAARYHTVLVDIGSIITPDMSGEDIDALFSYDGVHPNNEGHARIAELFWKGVEQALATAKP